MKFLASFLFALFVIGAKSQCDCDDGKDFVLSSGKCESYPASGATGFVEHCEDYYYSNTNTAWKCSDCKVQYHLASDTLCEDGGIANCETYTKVGTTYTCTSCADGYYVKSDNTCAANPATPANCAYFSDAATPLCTGCKEGHYLKSTEQECVANPTTPANCGSFSWSGSAATCNWCTGDFEWNGTECFKIGDKITNCQSGDHSTGTIYSCSYCSEGNMVDNKSPAASDECVANPADAAAGQVENCRMYSKTGTVVTCIYCNEHFGLKADGTCEAVATKVEDCRRYELSGSAWVCDNCKSEYYGNVSNNPTTCTKCPATKKNNSSANLLSISALAMVVLALVF